MSEVKLTQSTKSPLPHVALKVKRSSSLVVVSVLAVRPLNDLLLKVQTSLSTTLTPRLPKALQPSFVDATATAVQCHTPVMSLVKTLTKIWLRPLLNSTAS